MGRGHGDKLDRMQEQALAALLEKRTIAEAAAVVGVNEKTLREWLKDPGFAAAYRQTRRELLEASIGRIQAATGTAVDTLLAVAQDAEAKSADRLRAAGLLLEYAVRGAEVADVLHGNSADGEATAASPKDTGDVVAALGEMLRRVTGAELGTAEKARLVAALGLAMLKGIEVDTLAERLEALQRVLLQREDKR
jgi:hypothetical protein